MILPEKMARKIRPKPTGNLVVELADGRTIGRKAYEIEVEVIDEEKNETRKTKASATVEKRDYLVIGSEAMGRLGIILNMREGKIYFA